LLEEHRPLHSVWQPHFIKSRSAIGAGLFKHISGVRCSSWFVVQPWWWRAIQDGEIGKTYLGEYTEHRNLSRACMSTGIVDASANSSTFCPICWKTLMTGSLCARLRKEVSHVFLVTPTNFPPQSAPLKLWRPMRPLHFSTPICWTYHPKYWYIDTDVFIDLLDLVAHGLLGASTELRLTTGTSTKRRVINILCKCVQQIGIEKCKVPIGLHNFSCADWGGKFVGVSRKTRITSFLNLAHSDPVIKVFQQKGQNVLDFGDATSTIPVERFLCSVYSPSATAKRIPELRWQLFHHKNLFGEKLSPTIGTLIPHAQRANYMSMRDNSYRSPHRVLPNIINHGRTMNEEEHLTPLMCLNKPAPIADLDLIKCGCQTECKGRCSSNKHSLPCTLHSNL